MTENLNIKEEPFFIIGWSELRQVLFPELRKVAVLSGMLELAHFSEYNRDDEQRSIGGNSCAEADIQLYGRYQNNLLIILLKQFFQRSLMGKSD